MRLKRNKIAVAALALAVCISCTGCKSEEVKNTEQLIKDIGTVTLASEEGIEAAEEAYNALGDEQKDVSNAKKLTDSREKYNELYQKKLRQLKKLSMRFRPNSLSTVGQIQKSALHEKHMMKLTTK